MDYRAEFLQKLEEKEEKRARQKAEKGQKPPENLITWIFQEDFTPVGKITKDGCYSIINDYLGTPVEAYDGNGEKVWESLNALKASKKITEKEAQEQMKKELQNAGIDVFSRY